MSSLAALVGGSGRVSRPVTARARVVKPPAALDSSLTVVLANFSAHYEFEIAPFHWDPRGDTLPGIGDECLVVFDDEGDAWIPAWAGVTAYPATFVAGHGDPVAGEGSDGAIYLDLDLLHLWGPKADGAWPAAPFAMMQPLP